VEDSTPREREEGGPTTTLWGSRGRQKSARSKTKGEVDDDRQRNRGGNTG
jgi:hypothetical protein